MIRAPMGVRDAGFSTKGHLHSRNFLRKVVSLLHPNAPCKCQTNSEVKAAYEHLDPCERLASPDSKGWCDFVSSQVEGEVEGGHHGDGPYWKSADDGLEALAPGRQVHGRKLTCTMSLCQ